MFWSELSYYFILSNVIKDITQFDTLNFIFFQMAIGPTGQNGRAVLRKKEPLNVWEKERGIVQIQRQQEMEGIAL
jgi:hypothetical protein